MKRKRSGRLRIIAGKWRSRLLSFTNIPSLRPTTDTVRETVFNWLTPYIKNANCLDLFAGSGALGFEALSRGAKHVIMIDQSPQVVRTLQENALQLKAVNIDIFCGRVPEILTRIPEQTFNIIFVDPPFYQGLIVPCCQWLQQYRLLSDNTFVYIEAESLLKELPIPPAWKLLRSKKTGQVGYHLVQVTQSTVTTIAPHPEAI